MEQSLKEKIIQLIELKKEGKTWDFKANWYESKALLLHDILNMANNETNEDSFIIIGVNEENDYDLMDLTKDNNRYTQVRLNTLLRSSKVKFAGENIPDVKVENLNIKGKMIDVIIIKSTDKVPYYLSEDYIEKNSLVDAKKKEIIVYASKIYVRRNDSNTPITESAKDNEIEQLWKKRFGINLGVKDKFYKLLGNTCEWEQYEGVHFNKFNPDFTIKSSYEECNQQYLKPSYAYEQIDSSQHTYFLRIYFRNMEIDEYRVDSLDGGRMSYVYPNTGYLKTQRGKREYYCYFYFIKDDIRSRINNLFAYLEPNGEQKQIIHVIEKYVLFFNNEAEKDKFHMYLEMNIDDIFEEAQKGCEEYMHIKVQNGLNKEKIIEELCLQKEIVKIFNKRK